MWNLKENELPRYVDVSRPRMHLWLLGLYFTVLMAETRHFTSAKLFCVLWKLAFIHINIYKAALYLQTSLSSQKYGGIIFLTVHDWRQLQRYCILVARLQLQSPVPRWSPQ